MSFNYLIYEVFCSWIDGQEIGHGPVSFPHKSKTKLMVTLEPGSRYLPYLNSSTRIARTYSEHVRLCLNALALRPAAEFDGDVVDKCLEKGIYLRMCYAQGPTGFA